MKEKHEGSLSGTHTMKADPICFHKQMFTKLGVSKFSWLHWKLKNEKFSERNKPRGPFDLKAAPLLTTNEIASLIRIGSPNTSPSEKNTTR